MKVSELQSFMQKLDRSINGTPVLELVPGEDGQLQLGMTVWSEGEAIATFGWDPLTIKYWLKITPTFDDEFGLCDRDRT